MKFIGCFTALITPYKNGKIDWTAFEKIIEEQIAGNVAGVVPVGTTGESPTLSYEEHLAVIKFVVEKVNKRCLVIAGAGANSTDEAIFLTKEAARVGADATLQVTPYYNKPTQEGIFRHIKAISDAVDLPIVLYNVPGRSGVSINIDTVLRLSKLKNVAAIKEAAGCVDRVSQIRNVCDLTILSGDDSLTLPMMSVGASGVISVASNVIPHKMQELCQNILDNNFSEALKIHQQYYPFFRDIFVETNPIPIKAAMAMLGMITEEYRLPMCEISPNSRIILSSTMQKCGILK